MNKKIGEIKLYNVIFPVWLLFIFPITWLIVLPANFLIDSIVLIIGMHILKIQDKKYVYKKTVISVFLFGFLSDIIGCVILLLTQFFGYNEWIYEYLTSPIAQNPFDNIYALIYTILAVVIAGCCIYLFNRFVSFRKIEQKRTRKILSLLLAVVTAPYLLLFPTSIFYGTSANNFTNHIVSDSYIYAELYSIDDNEKDILFVESGEHFNYGLVSAFRYGINNAERTDLSSNAKLKYNIVFYKQGEKAHKMDKISIYEYNSDMYFVWKNKTYKIRSDDADSIKNEIAVETNSNNMT